MAFLTMWILCALCPHSLACSPAYVAVCDLSVLGDSCHSSGVVVGPSCEEPATSNNNVCSHKFRAIQDLSTRLSILQSPQIRLGWVLWLLKDQESTLV